VRSDVSESVLVTGGSGFIGGYVVDELRRIGASPVILDRQRGGRSYRAPTILGDVRDRVAVETAVHGMAGVIHLAGLLGTQETVRHATASVETNITGTLHVLDAALEYDIPTVVISVGNWWMNNSYSISKHCAERFALMYRHELGAKVSVVRALNAYGPGQKTEPVRKIIPSFATRALVGLPVQVYGDGEQVMDMVYVGDVAAILVRALVEMPDVLIEAGTGRPTTVNEIADAVIGSAGQGSVEHLPMRPGEEPGATVLADTSTLAAVGWSEDRLTTLEDAIGPAVDYYRKLLPS